MQAKCRVSVEVPLPDGGFKRYQAGTVYTVDGLDKATIRAYFEHPEVAPPKGKQTRIAEPIPREER